MNFQEEARVVHDYSLRKEQEKRDRQTVNMFEAGAAGAAGALLAKFLFGNRGS